jgi:hypothetical protein
MHGMNTCFLVEDISAQSLAPKQRELTCEWKIPGDVRRVVSYTTLLREGTYTKFADGEVIMWEQCDTFCIPAWKAHYLVDNDDDTVYFFSFSDRPLLEKLGMFRREEGGHMSTGSM